VDGELPVAVWRAASAARRGGRPVRAEHEERVRSYIRKPDAFLLLAEDAGEVVGMGVGMQGLADDGAGPPVLELCHIAMIFVAPERWGRESEDESSAVCLRRRAHGVTSGRSCGRTLTTHARSDSTRDKASDAPVGRKAMTSGSGSCTTSARCEANFREFPFHALE
jgi:hypothetical protein